MKQQNKQKIRQATREKLKMFDSLRGRAVTSQEFWDLVVVSAADDAQRESYEVQIRDKVLSYELPLVQYHVFSDPPGAKIGNGGSTLHCLKQLKGIFGGTLSSLKVMLIHAGGSSQRLPSASALGKIFMAVPLPLYQMLELKLAMYVEFPSAMKPGVLVTCADDVELYSSPERLSFHRPGFTALAHPSALTVGSSHGVFVLDSSSDPHQEMQLKSCLRFLHKPSVETMRAAGAVCEPGSPSELVYTDSTYYMDSGTALSLIHLLDQIHPLRCEIDAYGDFLQALGPDATPDYTGNSGNVVTEEETLVDVRLKIFHHLRGTPLNVILLNNSRFYHMGTTLEYLFHLTREQGLRTELGLTSDSCVMNSLLQPTSSVGPGSVVEFCRLEAGVSVGRGSVLSGCWVTSDLKVPQDVVMHTLSVTQENRLRFVTFFWGTEDDLKLRAGPSDWTESLSLCGLVLRDVLSCWGLEQDPLRFSSDVCSLWNVCLFPVRGDRRSSFEASLEMLSALKTKSRLHVPEDVKLTSMQESLTCKNLLDMLTFRRDVYKDLQRLDG